MITQIETVSIYVEDQQESLRFWTEKVGHEIKANHPITQHENWIELVPNGSQSAIVLYPKSLMPNWREMKSSIVFLCDDINETFSKLSSNDVRFTQEPKKMPWGTYSIFVDIDGNEFILKEEMNTWKSNNQDCKVE